jgi:hypothetical protein
MLSFQSRRTTDINAGRMNSLLRDVPTSTSFATNTPTVYELHAPIQSRN